MEVYMDILKEKYIIIEIIPTTCQKETGNLVQISALKLHGLQLLERFDYRLNPAKVPIPDLIHLTSYDQELFTYLESTEQLLEAFSIWSSGLPLLILDNAYTKSYLKDLPNEKISICQFLNTEYQDDIIEILIKKYHLEPSPYIVDLLYESIIREN